ncbi:MAG: hypothetical protein AB7O59_11340 [Pirellulales bacterium]
MLIEQAIFTSADTNRAAGYQLISRSPGLSEADARELAVWGPAHDSLLERSGELPASTNFHRLASGAYAVSRTTAAGAEYSGRGGPLVYTQFLVLPGEVLAKFANDPFAVLRAATASGAMVVYEQIPESLEPVQLGGRAPAVDTALLAQLAHRPGPTALATLLQAALSSDQLAVAANTPIESLFAGLLCLLPVECRPEFSFSTGLKFSPSRPFRLSGLPADSGAWRAIGRHGVTLLDLDGIEPTDTLSWEGWAGCVAEILAGGRISVLATQLERRRPQLTCAALSSVADELHAALHPPVLEAVAAELDDDPPPVAMDEHGTSAEGHAMRQRADAAHLRFAATLENAHVPQSAIEHLVETLAQQPAEVLEMLERVDDLVFTAIGGDQQALEQLQVLWPLVASEVDHDVVEQSREQYLRCALSIWSDCINAELRRPERAVSAIDVLCVLFDETA